MIRFKMPQISAFAWLSGNFFGYFSAYGVLIPFFPTWLNYYGYSASTIALMLSLAYLFRLLGGLLFARSGNLLNISRVLTGITALTAIGMMPAVECVYCLVAVFCLFHIFNGASMPLNETLASVWQKHIRLDYGKARLFGSLAFIVGSLLAGQTLAWLGAQWLVWLMVVCLLGQGLIQLCQVREVLPAVSPASAKVVRYRDLLTHPQHAKILFAVSLIQGSHADYYTFGSIHWQNHGMSAGNISLLWSVSVLAEMVLFFFAQKWLIRFDYRTLLKISALGATVRWSVFATTTSLLILPFAQMLHALSFALGHYAVVSYINQQSHEHTAKLQALYMGLSNCMTIALLTLVSGAVFAHAPQASFWLMACLSSFALIVLWRKK